FFFFSSRRRHTRFSRDWSSDVCSSDLQNVDDLNYFVLTTCQAFGLHIKLHKILISGVDAGHQYSAALGHFANRIEFMQARTDLHADDERVEKEVNKFNFIADAPLCVS